MLLEALGSVLIGLAVAFAGMRRFPERLPARPLVLATGPVASLAGCLITRAVMGPGHWLAILLGALVVGVALLSLLIRPQTGPVRRSAAV
ncbi:MULTISPECIES: hypothetical protein [Streptomyces]|uniref:Integral membrane protein n=1 Tax=Streptomyces lycii TaxID=2654337 RepID=A0ABQ7FNF3_9ACTN|nr:MULTISPECIES: hypothetical protein [Streptomyces]KAF4410355.1 hypothetical protein GCU69_04370 [Streptomyces lycii]PGH52403.1 hypothetical protein CRI70_01660 [Streptomyces sp. Ru87]